MFEQNTMTDDAAMIERLRAGDEAALAELITQYRGMIFGLVLNILHDNGDAEEVAQDVFIRAFRGISTFRGTCTLKTWLYKIAQNLAYNRYHHFRRRRRHVTSSLDFKIGENDNSTVGELIPSGEPDPARMTATLEFNALIGEAMLRLKPAHHDILVMRNGGTVPYDEIARNLGIKLGSVKSRLARARECLLSELKTLCPEFSEQALPADWLN